MSWVALRTISRASDSASRRRRMIEEAFKSRASTEARMAVIITATTSLPRLIFLPGCQPVHRPKRPETADGHPHPPARRRCTLGSSRQQGSTPRKKISPPGNTRVPTVRNRSKAGSGANWAMFPNDTRRSRSRRTDRSLRSSAGVRAPGGPRNSFITRDGPKGPTFDASARIAHRAPARTGSAAARRRPANPATEQPSDQAQHQDQRMHRESTQYERERRAYCQQKQTS